MLIMSVANKRLRLLGWTFFTSVILLLLTIGFLGLDTVLSYPSKLEWMYRAIDSHKFPDAVFTAVGILAPISLLFGMPTAHAMSFPLALISFGGAYLIWRQAIKSGKHTYPFAYASSVLIIFILAPLQHFYSLIMLCPVWAYTVPAISIPNILKIKERALRYWCFLFLSFPLLSWMTAYVLGYLCKMPGLGHLPLITLLFVVSLINFSNSLKTKTSSQPTLIQP
jgi:hypothetical protein